jgi:hypothetical protein
MVLPLRIKTPATALYPQARRELFRVSCLLAVMSSSPWRSSFCSPATDVPRRQGKPRDQRSYDCRIPCRDVSLDHTIDELWGHLDRALQNDGDVLLAVRVLGALSDPLQAAFATRS